MQSVWPMGRITAKGVFLVISSSIQWFDQNKMHYFTFGQASAVTGGVYFHVVCAVVD